MMFQKIRNERRKKGRIRDQDRKGRKRKKARNRMRKN